MRQSHLRLAFHIIAAIILIAAVCSCNQSGLIEILREADNNMESHPDSVLLKLEAIDSSELRGKNEIAYYRLLLTQARNKNWIHLNSDSALDLPLRYFENRDESLYCRTLFYKGRINYENYDYAHSIYFARAAYELSKKLGDSLLIARSSELIADNYRQRCQYHNALKYYSEAAEAYGNVKGKYGNYLYSLCDKGSVLRYINAEAAYSLFDSVKVLAKQIPDIHIIAYASYYQTNQMIEKGEFDKFFGFLHFLDTEPGYVRVTQDSINLAKIYLAYGQNETAKAILDSLIITDLGYKNKSKVLNGYVEYYKNKGDDKKRIEYLERLLDNELKSHDFYMNNTMDKIEAQYYSDAAEKANRQKAISRNRSYAIFVCIIIISTAIIILIYLNFRKRRSKFENAIQKYGNVESEFKNRILRMQSDIENLNNLLEFQKEDSKSLHLKVSELYRSKWHVVTNLCKYHLPESDTSDNFEIKILGSKISKIIDNEDLDFLIDIIDRNLGCIISKDLKRHKIFNDSDLKLFALIASGFGNDAIMLYMKIKPSTFYKKRTRLKEKLESSDLPNRERYLELFDRKPDQV